MAQTRACRSSYALEKGGEGRMIKYEDECVGCVSIGLPCLGSGCPNLHVPHTYCDECGEEARLYEYDGEELCIDCIERRLKPVYE